jgi:hypothetical protein
MARSDHQPWREVIAAPTSRSRKRRRAQRARRADRSPRPSSRRFMRAHRHHTSSHNQQAGERTTHGKVINANIPEESPWDPARHVAAATRNSAADHYPARPVPTSLVTRTHDRSTSQGVFETSPIASKRSPQFPAPRSDFRFPVMNDPLTKAKRFHALSQENIRLAESAANPGKRKHYCKIAEHYLILAEAELKAAISSSARPNLNH